MVALRSGSSLIRALQLMLSVLSQLAGFQRRNNYGSCETELVEGAREPGGMNGLKASRLGMVWSRSRLPARGVAGSRRLGGALVNQPRSSVRRLCQRGHFGDAVGATLAGARIGS